MEKIKLLSLVVPAYKQEKTIKKNIQDLEKTLKELNIGYEIIVVVDGIYDKTYENAKDISSKRVRVYKYEHGQGKGYAVKFGALKSKGNIVGFIDAGMDIDPSGILMLLNHLLWYDADIIVGSKMHPVSQVNYPIYRKILSWGYRNLTHTLFGFKVRDTQAGIKFYKRKVIEDVFPRLLVKNFAFDVEIFALAYALGYKRIYEAPIKLQFQGASSITSTTLWRTISHMLWDTFAVFYRVKIIQYYRKSNRKNWISNL